METAYNNVVLYTHDEYTNINNNNNNNSNSEKTATTTANKFTIRKRKITEELSNDEKHRTHTHTSLFLKCA